MRETLLTTNKSDLNNIIYIVVYIFIKVYMLLFLLDLLVEKSSPAVDETVFAEDNTLVVGEALVVEDVLVVNGVFVVEMSVVEHVL